jgi:hypothetical protein
VVRVKKGVYSGDLAKIIKVYHNRVKALIVPRVDLKLMGQKMKEADDKLYDKALLDRKNAIFRRLTDPREVYPPNKRPQKRNIPLESFNAYDSLAALKKLTITENGMLVLFFPLADIERPTGTILPIEVEPFGHGGNIVKEVQEESANTKILLGTILNNG